MSSPAEDRRQPTASRLWKNNRRVSNRTPLLSTLHFPEEKELLSPPPGTLLIGRNDLCAQPSVKDIVLYPYGFARLTVLLSEQWRDIFKAIKEGKFSGGIHLRSNTAQAQFDIINWEFPKKDENVIVVTLTNLSSDTAVIDAGTSFKLGNPYCYQSPLEGAELKKLAQRVIFSSGEKPRRPILLNKDDIREENFMGDSSLYPQHDLLKIPLTKAHPNTILHKKLNLSSLPSGPDREQLQEKIAVDMEGVSTTRSEFIASHHEPPIQLASTPAFTMPPSTALLLKSCIKNIGGNQYLVHHSASNIHRSEALVPGTSHYDQGSRYKHRVITESYNDIYTDIYPSSVLCEAFNLVVI